MSPVSRALRARFESVARAELARLKKKTASLSDTDRAELEAITVHVAQAIAAHLGEGMEGPGGEPLERIAPRIFALDAADCRLANGDCGLDCGTADCRLA